MEQIEIEDFSFKCTAPRCVYLEDWITRKSKKSSCEEEKYYLNCPHWRLEQNESLR